MATIDCLVDTSPMAREIDKVSAHVDGTTTAVVAMQTAVCKAQKDAADDVCANVNRGFYALMHSQLSQKIAKWKSDVDATLMQLNQQRRQLTGIRTRMEHDYGLLTARYSKLFGTLNRALRRRVYELDKAAFKFAVTEIDTIENRGKQLTATVPVSQTESLSTSQKIMASNLKHRAAHLLEVMKIFLTGLGEQKILTAKVLINHGIDQPEKAEYIPVIIWEGVAGRDEGSLQHIVMSRSKLSERSCQTITNSLTMTDIRLPWTQYPAPVDPRVRESFNSLMAKFDASPRVKETMARLFSGTSFQTLQSR